jgi:Mn2+/Fe2+ NRAMP family transporter
VNWLYGVLVVLGAAALAAALVLIPGAPLVPILFLSQALNAILLLPLLPLMRALARDPTVMGQHVIRRADSVTSALAIAVIAASVVALGVLSLT